MPEFKYETPVQLAKDDTSYRLLTKDFVETIVLDGKKILKVDPRVLNFLQRKLYLISHFISERHILKSLPGYSRILKLQIMTGLLHI